MKRLPLIALWLLVLCGVAGAASSSPTPTPTVAQTQTATPTPIQTAVPTAFATPVSFVCANAIGCKQVVVTNAVPQQIHVRATGATISIGYAATGTNCASIVPTSSNVSPVDSISYSSYFAAVPAGQDICVQVNKAFTGATQ